MNLLVGTLYCNYTAIGITLQYCTYVDPHARMQIKKWHISKKHLLLYPVCHVTNHVTNHVTKLYILVVALDDCIDALP